MSCRPEFHTLGKRPLKKCDTCFNWKGIKTFIDDVEAGYKIERSTCRQCRQKGKHK